MSLSPRALRTLGALVVLGVLAAGVAGPLERRLWQRYWLEREVPPNLSMSVYRHVEPRVEAPLAFDLVQLSRASAGDAAHGSVVVHYPDGAADAARGTARLLDGALARVSTELSFAIPVELHLYLVEVEDRLRSYRLDTHVEGFRCVAPLPFVDAGQSGAELLADPHLGGWVTFVALHELTEATLVLPGLGPTVLPDVAFDLGLPLRIRHHTRWFRDGFATYAAHVALRSVAEISGEDWPPEASRHAVHDSERPLDALARVGPALFEWDQFDPEDWQADYYPASFGLFLLIEARHGRAALRRVLEAIPGLPFPDGAALEDLLAKAVGTDPRALVAGLSLPDPGLETAVLDTGGLLVRRVRGGTPAERAGVRPDDVVVRIGRTPVVDHLDYDLALLAAGDGGPMDVTLEREGMRKTVRLGDGAATDATERETVVLLHGLGRSSDSMSVLEDALLDAGYRVKNLDYPSTEYPIAELVERLRLELAHCCADGTAKVHFVTHSLGGILVRALLAQHEVPRLGRVVMLSPPNQGSEIVDALSEWAAFELALGPAAVELGTDGVPSRLPPVDFELGVLTGDDVINPFGAWLLPGESDGSVTVESAKVEGMKEFRVVDENHTLIMRSPEVVADVLLFLAAGRFRPLPE